MDKLRESKNKKHAYRPRPPFAIVEGAGTPPFKKLDPEAVWVLLQLYSKFTGRNRSNLSLTYREARETMSERVLNRAIWQLLGYGFIDVVRWGRLERNCTLYGFSDRWRRLNTPEADDRLAKIGAILEDIEKLKREKWPEGRESEKRMRIVELQKSLFER
jgi:hypothetical protein